MNSYPATTDEKRKRNMRMIKSRNTSIEVKLRKALWRAGIRYRKNYTKLPGSPDIVLLKHKIAVFCDGEFWHGKDWNLKKDKIKSNREYWINKIERNILRDTEINQRLQFNGWTVIRFWGGDISKDVDRCVYEIKEAMFLCELDSHLCAASVEHSADECSTCGTCITCSACGTHSAE
ncbi:MAG: very short patch repair endonuclease [Oscillospiraceae bacterium]|nr:very short patch repair endonuclease [Oscillospiraceae bacterium]